MDPDHHNPLPKTSSTNQHPQRHKGSRSPTSDGLGVGGEHKQLDESQAQRRVVVLPDDGRDEEDLAVAGEQQRPEELTGVWPRGPHAQKPHAQPEETKHPHAERHQL